MKSLVLVAAATALLGACASTPMTSANTTASADTNAYGRDVDARKVNAINNVARVNGVDVHWINYPEARPASSNMAPVPAPTGT